MPAYSLSLFAAALPLVLAAPQGVPDFFTGCGQADRPCSYVPGVPSEVVNPSPTWSRGPYVPTGGSSGAVSPTGTANGTGTAPLGTGTGYPYPTGTAPAGSGIMSILPVESSSIHTYPIRSSSSIEQPITTGPSPQAETTEPAPSGLIQEAAADSVKGQFPASTTWTFGASGALPTGIRAATDHIGSEPLTHTFAKKNVYVEDGFLVLNVPGGQAGNDDISSAEISTDFDVQYASVRTWATLTDGPGVCNAMFFYESDSQETDIEWISDPRSKSNEYANNGTRAMQYTNQDLNGDFENASSKFGRAPEDATSVSLGTYRALSSVDIDCDIFRPCMNTASTGSRTARISTSTVSSNIPSGRTCQLLPALGSGTTGRTATRTGRPTRRPTMPRSRSRRSRCTITLPKMIQNVAATTTHCKISAFRFGWRDSLYTSSYIAIRAAVQSFCYIRRERILCVEVSFPPPLGKGFLRSSQRIETVQLVPIRQVPVREWEGSVFIPPVVLSVQAVSLLLLRSVRHVVQFAMAVRGLDGGRCALLPYFFV